MTECNVGQKSFHVLQRQRGFTLLEVMVAVAIIAIAFVSLLGSQSQSISMASISRFETMAALLAGQKVAEIQIADFVDLRSDEGDFEDDFIDFHWKLEVTELSADEIGISGADGMLKAVEVTISTGQDDAVYRLRSLVMRDIQPVQTK